MVIKSMFKKNSHKKLGYRSHLNTVMDESKFKTDIVTCPLN